VNSRTAVVAVVLTALVLTALGLVAGCGATPSSSPSKHASTSGAAAGSGSATPAPSAPAPTAPARTPLGAGERAWAAFSQRGVSYDTWWARLRPLLSNAARAVYVYDDPRKLPDLKLTSKIHLAAKPPAEPKYTAEAVVATSKGVFRLDLERHTLGSPWLLYAIKFPPAVQ
jgi:hypothetical protein